MERKGVFSTKPPKKVELFAGGVVAATKMKGVYMSSPSPQTLKPSDPHTLTGSKQFQRQPNLNGVLGGGTEKPS